MRDSKVIQQDGDIPEEQILEMLGYKANLWLSLREYLADFYPDCAPVSCIEGKNKDYVIRYRKSGRTLVTLYPARSSVVVLVVLGKKEVAKTEALVDKLSKKVRKLFQETAQLHDGRWLWISPTSKSDIESIKLLLSTKRRPKRLIEEKHAEQ